MGPHFVGTIYSTAAVNGLIYTPKNMYLKKYPFFNVILPNFALSFHHIYIVLPEKVLYIYI